MKTSIKRGLLAASLATAALMVGCAHPISVNPDTASIRASSPARIQKAVAYYVSPDDMKLEVTTPGGGGDKVTYFPYRDLDPAIYQALSQVFTSVIKSETPTPAAGRAVQLMFTPKLLTTSSSSSALTWPPTDFSVELTCKVTDAAGAPVTSIVVTGNGKAEFSEFKSDFSLSARRASLDAMNKLVKALESAPELRR